MQKDLISRSDQIGTSVLIVVGPVLNSIFLVEEVMQGGSLCLAPMSRTIKIIICSDDQGHPRNMISDVESKIKPLKCDTTTFLMAYGFRS